MAELLRAVRVSTVGAGRIPESGCGKNVGNFLGGCIFQWHLKVRWDVFFFRLLLIWFEGWISDGKKPKKFGVFNMLRGWSLAWTWKGLWVLCFWRGAFQKQKRAMSWNWTHAEQWYCWPFFVGRPTTHLPAVAVDLRVWVLKNLLGLDEIRSLSFTVHYLDITVC